MSNYYLTPDAQADLIEIHRFTREQWGEVQSKKYLSELRQTIHLLAEQPGLGKFRSDVGKGISSFPHANHVMYYMIHEHQLVLFGVLHKSMVPANHLDGRRVVL